MEAGEAAVELSPLAEYYRQCLALAREWADSGGPSLSAERSVVEVAEHVPAPPEAVPFEPDTLASVVVHFTDLGSEDKLVEFRTGFASLLEALPGSPLHAEAAEAQAGGGGEAWYDKDVFHLLAELLLFVDLADRQTELVGVVAWAAVVYGRDASSVAALLAAGRLHPGFQWGRADEAEETAWMADAVVRAVCRAEEYLGSEHVGELSLAQLIDGL